MAKWTKETKEFEMFGEFYNITKKWYDPIEKIEDYDAFVKEINEFYKKYKNESCGILAEQLGRALNNYVEVNYYTRLKGAKRLIK